MYNSLSLVEINSGGGKTGLLSYIFQDAVGVYKNNSYVSCLLRCAYLLPFRITVKFRFLQYIKKYRKLQMLTKFLEYRYRVKTAKMGCTLEPCTQIGQGVRFPHAFPLVINPAAVIGNNCIIYPNVQIGSTRTKPGAPIIGNNVFLGDGCHIIGNCKIGDWCFISPGAFVSKDVPNGSVVGFGLNNIISGNGKEIVSLYL